MGKLDGGGTQTKRGCEICLDPRDLNKAINREHYKMITLEEVTSQLSGAQYYTVLNTTSGYWAIPLSKESSKSRKELECQLGMFTHLSQYSPHLSQRTV